MHAAGAEAAAWMVAGRGRANARRGANGELRVTKTRYREILIQLGG